MLEMWIKPYFRSYKWRFTLIVLLSILTLLSTGLLMFTSGFLISKAALRPENILLVYVPIVGVRTFGIARAVLHYVERLTGHDAVLRILSKMRVKLYRLLEPQALFLRSRHQTGDLLGVLAEDIENLQNVYIRTVFPAASALVVYVLAVIFAGRFSWELALLAALYILILAVILPYLSYRLTRRQHRLLKQQRSGLYQQLTDAVMGISDWVISGRSSRFAASYTRDEAEVLRLERSLRAWARWRTLMGQLITGLAVLTALYWTGKAYAGGRIDVTLIAAFVLVVFPLMDAFLPVSEAAERVPQYQDSLERLDRVTLNTERGPEQGKEQGQVQARLNEKRGPAAELQTSSIHIKLSGVSFAYQRGQTGPSPTEPGADGQQAAAGEASAQTEAAYAAPSLSGIDLDLPQGSRIAVIGRSGAGKSTLLKLIQGALKPDAGQVTLNGAAAELLADRMPELVSVLNQSPYLFDTTVGNNIRLGRLEASDEEVRRAAEAAQLGALIETLPSGYDTMMHETGQRFSGGERQRVALARILLQDTPAVILDEPTIGLDPRTERELMATIFAAAAGKTLIWVTHHLIAAKQMDEIIFMDEGKIVMRGTHEELMESSERYRNLYLLDRPE
ncbi:amino acid ABC transporter ATP-binding/permease protein [Paenibacillus pinistramenti]|uniref:amino acid ABC transporter ATP-binding/permease protein n=1 Tax=Paenibacillus pinistramenti TaxID=1768003 RepID=UPI001108DC35|nr:amino acid ABC transporter ATP-binding/permease protein [Paenibacillus pinistramenti]